MTAVRAREEGSSAVDPMVLDQVRDILAARSGISLKEGRDSFLWRLIQERAAARACRSIGEYPPLLRASPDGGGEIQDLVEEVTIHETSFFRYREQFDALKTAILPEVLAGLRGRGTRQLRIWSVGCATGQEPYSIAMVLLGEVPFIENWECEILATDISDRAIVTARAGVYRAADLDGLPQDYRSRFLMPDAYGRFTVRPEVGRLVRFHRHNIAEAPFFIGMDIIFCRNVLIYFDKEGTRRAVEGFHAALRGNGYLLLGHSESISPHLDLFDPRSCPGAMVLRRRPLPESSSVGKSDEQEEREP